MESQAQQVRPSPAHTRFPLIPIVIMLSVSTGLRACAPRTRAFTGGE